MRIISGYHKGRTLKSPAGNVDIRPTTDRARETLFNILSNRINFENKTCLDLFCGTGSFGLEFLSRGGRKCTFVDTNINVIKENVGLLKLENNYEIIRNDAIKFLSDSKYNEFNIAFADPPYKYLRYDDLLKGISKLNINFILEHDKSYSLSDEFINNLILQKKIGVSFFSFFDFNKTI